MFTPELFTSTSGGPDQWFRKALAENEAYNWAPKAPLRMYYGDRDKDVSPEDAKFAAKYMTERGGNVKLVPVGPYEHTESMYHALPKIRVRFDEVSNGTLAARVQH